MGFDAGDDFGGDGLALTGLVVEVDEDCGAGGQKVGVGGIA